MKILILNCGGSSMKYQLVNVDNEKLLAKGLVDRMGTPDSVLIHESKTKTTQPLEILDFEQGIKCVISKLIDEGTIDSIREIDAFAHKLAFGGPKYTGAYILTQDILAEMEEYSTLLPVHNPPMVSGVRLCQKAAPDVPQIGVFETMFHETIPEYAKAYGLPFKWKEEYGIRKYGFHGTSHTFVTERASSILKRSDLKIVSCHLGSGTSVAAVENGRSVDISSGLTPQSGTIMSTRPGDFDPWAILYMMEKENMTIDQINTVLIKEGGLKGISNVSGDMRDLKEAAKEGNKRAEVALQTFWYQIRKYIGSFTAVMDGLDALIFTGGIGEKDPITRLEVAGKLKYFGIELDEDRNNSMSGEGIISKDSSKVSVLVIPTNEELIVARHAKELLKK